MKLTDVQTGDVFNIENTPSYPKLKIDGGYVDIRDEIVNKTGNCDEKEVYLMDLGDLSDRFEEPQEELAEELDLLLRKYN